MKAKNLTIHQKINYRSYFRMVEEDSFFMRANRIYRSFMYSTSCVFDLNIPYHKELCLPLNHGLARNAR